MRITKIGSLILLLPIIGLFSSCEHAEAPTSSFNGGNNEARFDSIQVNIFNQSCAFAGCHDEPNPGAGLILTEGNAYDNLVEVRSAEVPRYFRVEPENPDSSYIIMKLEGSENIRGEQMPRGREPLSEEKINYIREWIENGANR